MAVYRVNKNRGYTVMANYHLRDKTLSLKAVGLLSKMLSFNDGWQFSTKGLSMICKEGPDAVLAALRELEDHGYLVRHRQRDSKGRMSNTVFEIYEQPQPVSPHREKPDVDNPDMENPHMENPHGENPAQLNTNPQKTKKSKTDISRTHQSIYPEEPETAGCQDGIDRMDMAEAYRGIIKENIEYDFLVPRYGQERMDETVELMLETVLSRRPYIRIAGDDFPREVVRSRFLKINSDHLEYVFDCIDKNVTKVNNIKAYLLAALYNAPATMDSYYRAEVNHDLYGC